MPLVKNEAGEPIGTECINKCGSLSRLDKEVSLVSAKGGEHPRVTVLVCSSCHYCELYWGSV